MNKTLIFNETKLLKFFLLSGFFIILLFSGAKQALAGESGARNLQILSPTVMNRAYARSNHNISVLFTFDMDGPSVVYGTTTIGLDNGSITVASQSYSEAFTCTNNSCTPSVTHSFNVGTALDGTYGLSVAIALKNQGGGNFGGTSNSNGASVIVDNIAPTVPTVIYPSATGIFVNPTAGLTITWATSTDQYFGVLPISVKYSLSGTFATDTVTIGNYSANTTSLFWNPPNVTNTTTRVAVVSTDAAGNSSYDYSDNPFTIDNQAPAVYAGGSIGKTTSPFVPSATATDNITPTSTLTYAWVASSTPASGTLHFSATNILQPTIWGDVTGPYVATLTVCDQAANCASDNLLFNWDGNPGQPIIISPAAGVYLKGGATTTIAWAGPNDPDLHLFSVSYSPDNGLSWGTVANGLASTTHSIVWTVPPDNTSTALIRVTVNDIYSNTNYALSGNFTVDSLAPTGLLLSNPTNPGINFKGGSNYNITWIVPTDNFAMAANPIKLELSLDGQFNDTVLIANNLPDTGTYAWTATTTQSTSAKIRVSASDLVGNSTSSVSVNPFTLDSQPPIINISTPSLGTISTSTSAGVTVADNYSGLASVLWTKVSGLGTIFFTPSATSSSPGFSADLNGDYVAMITATDNVGQVSTSTVSFHWDSGLTAPTIISPVAGYYIKGNATSTIVWTSGATQNHYAISYFNGATWTTVNSNYPGPTSSLAWFFPGDNTNQALIRVVAYDAGGNAATSTGTAFTVDSISPAISVSNPTSATLAKGGANLNITWTASDTNLDANNVGLDYSLDNGSNWTHIATTTNASSPYAWAAVATDTLTAKIRATAKDLAGNSTATITPAFIIDSTGPVITIASSSLGTITATTSTGVSSVIDNYSGVASTVWTKVSGPGTVTFSPSNATTSPTVAANLSGSYIVRLTTTDNVGNVSTQDLIFIWNGNPGQPTIIHPNAGDYLMGNATTTISWTVPSGPAIDYYNIEYSLNGVSWLSVGTTTANSILWLTPTVNTSTAQVRVTAWASGNPTTATGTDFTIDSTKPTVSITTPGTPVKGGASYNIVWTASDNFQLAANVSLDYSLDSGSTWAHIATTSALGSPYAWTATTTESTTSQFRVTAWDLAGNTQSATTSNFVLDSQGPIITRASSSLGIISTPTAAGVGPVYDNYSGLASLVWTQASGAGTISFSPTATTTNPLLSGTTSGNYTALVTATDNVGNVSTSTVAFYWDGALGGFSVITPTAGNYLPGNSTTTISWTTPSGGNLNYYSLDYSLNGGTSWNLALPNGASVASTATSTLWSMPGSNSTSSLVRVTAHTVGGGTQIATSSLFAIDSTDPTASITTPATPIAGNTSYNITWTASDNIQLAPNAVLYYSSNNGSNWFQIATTSPTSSPYSWTATTTESTSTAFKIMVWDMAGHSHAVTTSLFTVDNNAPIITIASSSLGVISTPAKSHATSTDNYSGVASTVWTQTGGSGTITFSPSATSSDPFLSADLSGNYSALLTATDNVGHVSTSTVTFSWLGGAGAFSVLHPITGDYLMANHPATISWTTPPGGNLSYFDLGYTINGTNWLTIATSVASTTNTYSWLAPAGVNSSSSAVRVIAYDIYHNPTTATGTNFVIDATPPTISVNTPGTPLTGGQVYNITWTASDNFLLGPIISLKYSLDNGLNWGTVGTTTNATTSYAWSVPNTDSTSTLIQALEWDMAGNTASATTSVFTISSQGPIITIASSSLGTISNYTSAGVTVTDNYSGVASIVWTKIVGPVGGSINYAPDNATASPAFAATLSGHYVAQIVATNFAGNSSTSTVQFDWNGTPATPYIIHPLFGDYLAGHATTTISWVSPGGATLDHFDVYYAPTVGGAWQQIGGDVASSTTSIPWYTPLADTATNIVMVKAVNIYGESTSTVGTPFVIDSTPPTTPTILTPNALTTPLQGGSNFNITWTPSTDLNFGPSPLKLDYSADGLFDDSVNIATGTATNTAFNWTVPAVNTATTSRVRATAIDLVGHSGVSTSSAFIIDSLPPTITMAANLGTTSVPIHPNPTFSDNVDNDSQLTYSWSMDSAPLGGTLSFSAPFIANPTLSGDVSGDYTALLTVTDRAGNQSSATTTFAWSGNPGQPTLIYPAGGEFLPAGTINIQWSIPTTSNLDHFNVDYSLDNGTTWQWIAQGLNAASSSLPWTIAAPDSTSTIVRVTAVDASHNQTSAESGLFTIDTTAPLISAGSLGAITSAAAPGASATDNIDGPGDMVYAWTTVSTPVGANINFSAANILNPLISGTALGTYAALLTVHDRAGNAATSPLSFTWSAGSGSSGSSGGGGGGLPSLVCTAVIYSPWGACNGNIQFRTIVSTTPGNCSPSSAQQLAISQSCSSDINNQSGPGATTTPVTTVGTNAAGFDLDATQIMDLARKYQTKTDANLLNKLTGQILIQTESHGYAWYVNPATKTRYYLGSASNAFQVMRLLGLGMSNANLNKLPVALLPDSIGNISVSGDSLAVRLAKALGPNWQKTISQMKANPTLLKLFSGRILLQVQTNGEAWYLNPKTKKRYYLGRPEEAKALMVIFGVGISNKDINKIPVATFTPAQLKKVTDTLQAKTKTH